MIIPEYRIVATDRSREDHQSITHLIDEYSKAWPVSVVISHIDNNTARFYTLVNGKRAVIGVNGKAPFRYVQTHADGYWNNNLLALPIRRVA